MLFLIVLMVMVIKKNAVTTNAEHSEQKLTIEVAWNPRQDIDNSEKHHFFFSDYDSYEETYWKVRYPNEEGTGEVYRAFVKALSRGDFSRYT